MKLELVLLSIIPYYLQPSPLILGQYRVVQILIYFIKILILLILRTQLFLFLNSSLQYKCLLVQYQISYLFITLTSYYFFIFRVSRVIVQFIIDLVDRSTRYNLNRFLFTSITRVIIIPLITYSILLLLLFLIFLVEAQINTSTLDLQFILEFLSFNILQANIFLFKLQVLPFTLNSKYLALIALETQLRIVIEASQQAI